MKTKVKNDKCTHCPLAVVLEAAIGINKALLKQKINDFKPVTDYGDLLNLSQQLN
jgi:hypothetical protein